jgi:hypothetical protein
MALSVYRSSYETDKAFAEQTETGVWIKTEIRNVGVKVEITKVKFGDSHE